MRLLVARAEHHVGDGKDQNEQVYSGYEDSPPHAVTKQVGIVPGPTRQLGDPAAKVEGQ